MNADKKPSDASCPVDHNARAAWLRNQPSASAPNASGSASDGESCNSSTIDQASPGTRPSATSRSSSNVEQLGSQREISSIPRAHEKLLLPNHEQETKASRTGNWIYPSEQMFFDAMRRKNYDPRSEDMKTIVPIHNAVNERAWTMIKQWEKGQGAEKCGGPRLCSFSGNSQAMTPRARFNTLMGYTAPFDRHDWVIDRCGKKVEYVIDFYSGKDETGGRGLSFYLDVRPKLNSMEGVRMRMAKAMGFS